MGTDSATTDAPRSFLQRINGRYNGLVRLADAFHLAAAVVEYNGWYLLEPSKQDCVRKATGAEVGCHLEELLEEILREEQGIWSTLIYVQDITDPQIIKVYHPRRAGCGCGGGGGIIPWWVLSRIAPEQVPEWQQDSCATSGSQAKSGGLGWFKKLF